MIQLFLNPYINFQGKAREAMEFYRQALGGELVLLSFGEGGVPKAAEPNEPIMHSRLESDTAVIMGTDGSEDYPVSSGDNVAIALGGSDEERLSKIFEVLSEGSKVKQPLTKQPFGIFGSLEDKYGISWIVNISEE